MRSPAPPLETPSNLANFVGQSPAVVALRDLAMRVARTSANVFITGETGVGKEVLARFLYAHSSHTGPFVALNCAALPEALVESELFGHERGAFTGALASKPGCFEAAHRGVLFLDEVTEAPLGIQAKLLRALQEREVRRVGSTQPRKVDVCIIAASNRPPRVAVAAGALREDLYYRLRVIELHIPPLLERRSDLPLLADFFLKRYARRHGSALQTISPAALEAMDAYEWPGNVRELENVIERAVVIARPEEGSVLLPSHLPEEIQAGECPSAEPCGEALDLRTGLLRLKCHYVRRALQLAGDNRSEAARLLGISRRSFYVLLEEIGSSSDAQAKGGTPRRKRIGVG